MPGKSGLFPSDKTVIIIPKQLNMLVEVHQTRPTLLENKNKVFYLVNASLASSIQPPSHPLLAREFRLTLAACVMELTNDAFYPISSAVS